MNEIPTDANQLLAAQFSTAYILAAIAIYILSAIALWKVFSKAGYPGILAWIPIVNTILLLKIAGYSGWLVLVYLIPIANIILAIFVALRIGERFGKGVLFSLLWLLIFPIIGFFVLGFGQARYRRL